MASFKEKLRNILQEGTQPLNEDQKDSPTRLKPEKGEDVTKGNIDGTKKIDATGPIKGGADATLHTEPGNTTGGPTGHIPGNSDLPQGQKLGLDKSNKGPGKAKYTLGEEADEKPESATDKVEEGKLPPFLAKLKTGKKDKDDKKEDVKEEKDEKEKVEEETCPDCKPGKKCAACEKKVNESSNTEPDESMKEEGDPNANLRDKTDSPGKSGKEDNDRAGYTKKMKGDKVNEEKDEEDEKKEDKKAVEEASKKLMDGEKLSESFKVKTSVIFEEALSKRIKAYRKKISDKLNVQLNEKVEEIRESLTERVNGHLDFVVNSWLTENKLPVENVLKNELLEDFIVSLRECFVDHYIDVPLEKVDVIAQLTEKVEGLQTKLNESLESAVSLRKQNVLQERNLVLSKVTSGMAATQSEKVKTLSESIDFKNTTQFEAAVVSLKESVSSNSGHGKDTKIKSLTEQTLDQNSINNENDNDVAPKDKKVNSILQTMNRMSKV